MHVAPGGQERKALLHSAFDVAARTTDESAVAAVEAELPAMCADEIEDGAERLALRSTQATTKLLEEQRRALGGTQHQHGVDRGHVDTFVEEVNREDDADLAGGEVLQRRLAVGRRAVTPHRDRRNADAC